MSLDHSITISEDDFSRLHVFRGHAQLAAELDNAIVVKPDRIPPDVVTMNSRVRFEDRSSGEIHDVTIVFPKDADGSAGRGLGVGDRRHGAVGSSGGSIDYLALPRRDHA